MLELVITSEFHQNLYSSILHSLALVNSMLYGIIIYQTVSAEPLGLMEVMELIID